MSKATDMVSRLRQSVAEILGSDAPDKDELLKKSFDEFEGALAQELEAAPATEGAGAEAGQEGAGDPLLDFASAINNGIELAGALAEGGAVDEETAALLEHWAAMGDLALRAVVNNHVEPVDETEELTEEAIETAKADGILHFELPLAKADGGEEGQDAILVRTSLPEALAQLAVDPAEIQAGLADLGLSLAAAGGLDVERMLAKFDPNGDANENGTPDGQEMGVDPEALAELAGQLQVLMRLNAAALVQGEAIMRALGGEEELAAQQDAVEEEAAEGGGADEGEGKAPPTEAKGNGEDKGEGQEANGESGSGEDDDDKRKPPFEKADMTATLQKAVADALAPVAAELKAAQAKIRELESRPAAPKIALNGLSKAADGGGQDDESPEALAERLAKMSDADRTRELLKLAHKAPIPIGI